MPTNIIPDSPALEIIDGPEADDADASVEMMRGNISTVYEPSYSVDKESFADEGYNYEETLEVDIVEDMEEGSISDAESVASPTD